jgi:hypothetical protein
MQALIFDLRKTKECFHFHGKFDVVLQVNMAPKEEGYHMEQHTSPFRTEMHSLVPSKYTERQGQSLSDTSCIIRG